MNVHHLPMAVLDAGARGALRASLSDAIHDLMGLLDAIDGDPDEEADGDELDGSNAEDDFMHHGGYGPGCPIADSDHCLAHDDDLTRAFSDGKAGDPEDGEEDDHPGGNIDDEPEGLDG